jgi:hypothetical protein
MVKNRLAWLLSVGFIGSISPTHASNGAKTVDLRKWSAAGGADAGQWTVSAKGNDVFQKINGHPTVFLSDQDYAYRVFSGGIEVRDTGDDDYIGFVFGYSPDHFYVFDWRRGQQRDHKPGFYLFEFKGTLAELRSYSWKVHYGLGGNKVKVLATDIGAGKGWVPHKLHKFNLQVTRRNVKVDIDGRKIFDVSGEFKTGKFGFFNWSQGNVSYKSIEQLFPPVPSDLSVSAIQGYTVLIEGEYTDENANDTHTCAVQKQPKHGRVEHVSGCTFRFYPSPDFAGSDDFLYKVTDVTNLSSDGQVSLNIKPLGMAPTLSYQVHDGDTARIAANPIQPGQSITFDSLPNWMNATSQHQAAGQPSNDNLGIHKNIWVRSRMDSRQLAFGPFDLNVLGKNTAINLEPKLTTLPASGLQLRNDKAATGVHIPRMLSDDGQPVSGVHQFTLKLDQKAPLPIKVNGNVINPGTENTFEISLSESGTFIPIEPTESGRNAEGSYAFELSSPDLTSVKDKRILSIRSCGANDSSACIPKLAFHETSAPRGSIQMMVIGQDLEVKALYSSNSASDYSGFIRSLNQAKNGDYVVATFNALTPTFKPHAEALANKGKTNLVNQIDGHLAGSAAVAFEVGGDSFVDNIESNWRWGTMSSLWLPR